MLKFTNLYHSTRKLFSTFIPPKIYNNMLDVIGNTPLVRLNRIPKEEGVQCEILAKCEFLNPFGSQKDRIANVMLREAEKLGRVNPGAILIEPTSGNTGISVAMVAQLKGYKSIITMPEKSSQEKQDVMKVCGAQVIRTPTEAVFDQPESHFSVARKLQKEIPNSFILDQYGNPHNPLAHYEGTGYEVAKQCDNKLDYIFVPTGTGGTISGIGKIIKEMIPTCKVIGVDPYGSIIAQPDSINERKEKYLVEGYGHGDFVPRVIQRQYVDEWIKTLDKESLMMTRRLIKDEGMFVGGTSGAVLYSAIQYAKDKGLNQNHRICVILADTFRNYMTKVICDEWMIEKGFLEPEYIANKDSPLNGVSLESLSLKTVPIYPETLTVGESIKQFEEGQQTLFIVENNKILGAITKPRLMQFILDRKLKSSDLAKVSMTNDVSVLEYEKVNCGILEKMLEKRNEVYLTKVENDGKLSIFYATQNDILNYLSKQL